jgi:hypothetical protein
VSKKSQASQVSDAFRIALKKVCPDLREPDRETKNGQLGKAPDFYLPSQRVALEMKSVSVDRSSGGSLGESTMAAKQQASYFAGTRWVEFTKEEFRRLSDRMTGRLRRRIQEAAFQLKEFHRDDSILSVCCLFVEVSEELSGGGLREWGRRYLPTRLMVQTAAVAEFKDQEIDVLIIYTLDERGQFSLDMIQSVYENNHLKREYELLMGTILEVSCLLPIIPDFSIPSAVFFEEKAG